MKAMISALRCCLVVALSILPSSAGTAFDPAGLAVIDDTIRQAVTDAKMPGGVFRMERHGVVYQKAYGDRAIFPEREPMTGETIFDAASLTKVIATTPAVMKLVEAGKIDVEAPLSRYLPGFKGHGKEAITVRQLLTHTSGLRAGLSPDGNWKGKDGALQKACAEPLPDRPGTAYRYSDINFILLGLLVERVTGEPLDEFCEREIYEPLGMNDTGFRDLAGGHVERIAPTTMNADGTALRGIVHDPTARRMGGVAGHAGLFLTAGDLGRFARMMSGDGVLDGVRVFEEETVKAMTSAQSPDGLPKRGFGWDIDSPYAGPRGSIFPVGSYGHTGWTGTRIWIDPHSKTSVIFLSNRNHPDEKGNVIGLQRELGTLAAQAITGFDFGAVPPPARKPASGPVLNGIDVLKRDRFRQLRGRKVGLITNHTGIDRGRNPTIDLLHAAPGVKLVALFSPEHGIRGNQDQPEIGDTKDNKTGLPVHSLYGKRRTPTESQLAGIDTLVFDIQDIGCRFYTYISTMTNCLEAAGTTKRRFIVLDRANPIGPRVEGPVLTGERSFIATHEIPLRHGMTVGELARLINAERKFGTDLGVIRCEGGSPLQWFDATGQPWRDPSPNMRSLTAATLYPGVGLLEFCKASVGRGTGTPFELLGAPYMDDLELADELNRAALPGTRFVPVRFTPDASVFAGQECRGVRILLTDRDAFRAAELGIVLARALHRLYGDKLDLGRMAGLLGDQPTLDAIRAGETPGVIMQAWKAGLERFEARRQPHLLYPR